uniref:Alpha-N-acetylglucosaminidase n=2 Tax=Macrostomum lignano TaxID=282301 RepID=A0A1I8JDC8_9PLAT
IRNTGRNNVSISANSGVAAAWALHRYLTGYCSAMVSWSGTQVALPPDRLPMLPSGQLTLESQDVYTVMPNVVTFSYSYVWWRFSDWERHIDWMALHGVNLAYALTGQERVMAGAMSHFGLTEADLVQYFPGPAFLAWGRMGNLKAWGGPLSKAWCDSQVDLQRRILDRMAALGITSRAARNVKVFGHVTHHYAMDPFNENLPSNGDPAYIRAVSAAILNGFLRADLQGVWVLQSWFLNNAADFWTINRAKAFFEPINMGETVNLAQQLDGFFGHNFVWTALHNFGGNNAMYGQLQNFGQHGPFGLRRQFPGNMLGTGIQPEGIGQNEVVYELVMEFNWRAEQPESLAEWIRDYARRRYGRPDRNLLDAWEGLLSTVYNTPHTGMLTPVLVLRPSLSLSENANYNVTLVESAWRLLIATNQSDNAMLNYDQVDLTRQMLQIRFHQYYTVLKQAAHTENATAVEASGATMLGLLDRMEKLLQTDERFLLQRLINSAKSFAASPSEIGLYEFNIRNQLTCWGPGPNTIQDYAARMYSGLLAGYYRPRWALFLHQLATAIRQ